MNSLQRSGTTTAGSQQHQPAPAMFGLFGSETKEERKERLKKEA
jgi:hypothetical protein